MRNEMQFLADWEIGHSFTQLGLNKGLKTYGDRARRGAVNELVQFVEKDVLWPVHIDKTTPESRKQALRLIMVIKEKRDGKVKGRV